MTLANFNEKYKYVSDVTQYGRKEHWVVMKPNAIGFYEGDCEDYALTVKKYISEYKDWELWYCKLNGNGHCVLRKGNNILCSGSRKPTNIEVYIPKFTATGFFKYPWVLIKIKMFGAMLQRLYSKVM
jgi:hypothetical protein